MTSCDGFHASNHCVRFQVFDIMEGLPPALSSDDDEVQGNNEAEEVEESDDEIDHSFEFGGILVSLDVSHDQRRTC